MCAYHLFLFSLVVNQGFLAEKAIPSLVIVKFINFSSTFGVVRILIPLNLSLVTLTLATFSHISHFRVLS